jgi:hypothetical protein
MRYDVRTVKLMHSISIHKAWASGPWSLTSGWLNFVSTTCLIKDSVQMETHIVRTIVAFFPYLCLAKKSFNLLNTKRRLDMLLRSPDGCKLEQFEGSWQRGRSGWKVLVVRTDDALTVERPNRTSCCPDGCKGSDFLDLKSMQNLLETYLWKRRLLKMTKPLIKSNITWKWFCPTECTQLQTNKLPLWPFWDENTWPIKNKIPVQIKKYSPFSSQNDKG